MLRPEGLYCPPGDFYIDPWRPVDRAVITHAHGDHARAGHGHYLAAAPGETVMRARLGTEIDPTQARMRSLQGALRRGFVAWCAHIYLRIAGATGRY